MPYFYELAQVARREPVPGVGMRAVWGDKVMLNWVDLAPKAVVPLHSHPHEQAGIVLEGQIEMTIGGETRVIGVGEAYVIPGGVEHKAVGSDEPSLVLDIFSPPREDYKES
jgi:quercetin dioxygenase-like cupin family protein